MVDDSKREYLFGNSMENIAAYYNEARKEESAQNQANKKKTPKIIHEDLTVDDILSDYKYLPF